MRKIFLFVFFLFAGNSLAQEVRDLRILHWNDFHSRNMPYEVQKKKDGETTRYYVGGAAGLFGYIKQNMNSNTIKLHGGDEYQGTPISSITNGFSQIQFLNVIKPDYMVLGNHDFDYGYWMLDSAINIAQFNTLGGNVLRENINKPYASLTGFKVVNDIKIGFLGLSPEELPTLTLPKNIQGLRILNTDSVLTEGISALKSFECDLIVLLSHNGIEYDSIIASKFHKDIDVIVSGHDHKSLSKPKIVNGTLIVESGWGGRYLGLLDIQVDIDKDTVISYKRELIETVLDESVTDKDLQAFVEKMEEAIKPELQKVIGKLEIDWDKDKNLGQWQADAFRKKTNSDIAFLNSGGVRKNLLAGNITVGDIWEINPFGNTINLIRVKGSFLKEMIANHLKKALEDYEKNGYYDYLIVSGLYVEYSGNEMKEGKNDFLKSVKADGKEIDDEKIYVIATNNYTATQINKYFGNLSEPITPEETNIIDRDLIIEAVKEAGIINNKYEDRILNIDELKN